MSSKQLIESLANEDLFTAKKLIHEALTEKMGNALEDKLIDFAPSVFNEGKLSPKQKKIAKLAGDKEEIDAPDFAALRKKKKKHVKEDVDEIQEAFEAELKSLVEEIEEETGEELSEEEIINIAEMLLDMINEEETEEKTDEDEDEDEEDQVKPAVKLQKPNTSNVRLGTNAEY